MVHDETTLSHELDPTGSYEEVSGELLEESCGLIPMFFINTALSHPQTAAEMFNGMLKCYQYGSYTNAFTNCVITNEGMYRSEDEDEPDLAPYAALRYNEDIECLIYPSGIVAVRSTPCEGTVFITRMD